MAFLLFVISLGKFKIIKMLNFIVIRGSSYQKLSQFFKGFFNNLAIHFLKAVWYFLGLSNSYKTKIIYT